MIDKKLLREFKNLFPDLLVSLPIQQIQTPFYKTELPIDDWIYNLKSIHKIDNIYILKYLDDEDAHFKLSEQIKFKKKLSNL